ncbi:hypothetical protein [Vibrio phage XZ1]|nr:hypothetical protein [Vibrio phage XZ1]
MKVDSVDKIAMYMSMVSKTPFRYKGNLYVPKTMRIQENIRKGFLCPASCGSCCGRWSLDYLPNDYLDEHDTHGVETRAPLEAQSDLYEKRVINVNGKDVVLLSDTQEKDYTNRTLKPNACRNVSMTGRCDIHNFVLQGDYGQPFSCDFEIIRFISPAGHAQGHVTEKQFKEGIRYSIGRITTDLYANDRHMRDVHGKWREMKSLSHPDFIDVKHVDLPGPKCKLTDVDEDSVADAIRKFRRLQVWSDYFGIETWLDEIIDWLETKKFGSFVVNAQPQTKYKESDTGYTNMKAYNLSDYEKNEDK